MDQRTGGERQDELTPRQAFKFGFLLRCAEEGLTDDETEARVALLAKQAGWEDALAGVATKLPIAGLAATAGLGATGGYLLAKAREGTLDPEEIKRQELIAAYNTHADRIRARNALRNRGPAPAGVGLGGTGL